MNDIISGAVAIFAVALVVGVPLYLLNNALGEWATLMWVGIGLAVFFGIARRINA